MFSPWWKGSLQGWFRHKLQEMRNVLANAQGSVHIHCMVLSTAAYSISDFTTGSSICKPQPPLAEDKQTLMEPQSVPNKLQPRSSFLLFYKRLKVTSSHELSGKTVISSGRQCRSWRDHFCQKSQQGEGPHSERLEGSNGILQQLWALSTNMLCCAFRVIDYPLLIPWLNAQGKRKKTCIIYR